MYSLACELIKIIDRSAVIRWFVINRRESQTRCS